MNDCRTCGRQIKLRALTVRVNGSLGCSHWLEPRDGGGCPCLKDWVWVKWRRDKAKPTVTETTIEKWNTENPA